MPTALRVLNGNPGKRPLPEHEPQPAVGLPLPPSHLSKAARVEWRRIGQQLVKLGVMTEIDRTALAAYCQVYARWADAEEHLTRDGVIMAGTDREGNPYFGQSPYLSVANKALEQMSRMLIEFGMTPSSRSRVHAQKQTEEDPFEDFLQQRSN